jgi:UMF1 family MFS transporter
VAAPRTVMTQKQEPPRKSVFAWCLFDFANSSYTTLIITVAFPIYFIKAVEASSNGSGDRLWGLANFIAMAIVVLTAPLLGAVADFSGKKKLFLILSTLLCVAGTASLFFVSPGDIVLAMVLYILATVGFEGGYVFYNSFLTEVSTPQTIGRISGWAWAVGFIGGLLALFICSPWISSDLQDASGAFIADAVRDRQISFLLVAGFFLLFALPTFLWLKESRPPARKTHWSGYAGIGLRRIRNTLTHLGDFKETGKFILASAFFNDGISTTIIFSGSFAVTSFGFTDTELPKLFLMLNLVAFPGALGAGYLADRIGAKKTLVISLFLWIAVIITGFMATDRLAFWIMASGAAIGMGSTQAVGRSFMAQLTPPERESEFFGFYVLSGKFGSLFGPLMFGLISHASGNQHLAVLSILPFFIVGLLLVLSIDERKSQAQLAASRSAHPETF